HRAVQRHQPGLFQHRREGFQIRRIHILSCAKKKKPQKRNASVADSPSSTSRFRRRPESG
ncbi:hypothetical protein VU06_05135, partial [Desulfobulbus sp. F3]|nr:hypothetical protein [Desulfobulbus sp. F3]